MTKNWQRNLSLGTRYSLYFLYISTLLICLCCCSNSQSKSISTGDDKLKRAATSSSHLMANRFGNKLVKRLEGTDQAGVDAAVQAGERRYTPLPKSSGSDNFLVLNDKALVDLQLRKAKNVPVQATVLVGKILPDDLKGRKHQRFLLNLTNRTTVLVAHNTDLAKRVPLKSGDLIEIKGEYIWNEKGGVLHYTHHSTSRRKAGGWIKLAGITYQ